MFGTISIKCGSPATDGHTGLDRSRRFPRWKTPAPEPLEESTFESSHDRRTAGERSPGLWICRAKVHRSTRKVDIERAGRLLAGDLTYIAHPSFDDPTAHDAILAPSPASEPAGPDRTLASRDADASPSRRTSFPSREQEVHLFRKMNYLKCLACRIRDRIDPDSPDRGDLDQLERLQAESLKLKNQIVETHMRLAVSVAKRQVRAGYDLSERISDGNFALMLAVDRFDSRGELDSAPTHTGRSSTSSAPRPEGEAPAPPDPRNLPRIARGA